MMPPELIDQLERTAGACGIRVAIMSAYQIGLADGLGDIVMMPDDQPRMIDELGAIVARAMDLEC